jgi:hypothetical protein
MLMQLHVTCMQLDAACDDDGRANSRLADQGSLTGASSALEGQENTENEARAAASEMEECGDASGCGEPLRPIVLVLNNEG